MFIINQNGNDFHLEHTLRGLFKWEGTWKKPFLVQSDKTYAEVIDYMLCSQQPGEKMLNPKEITKAQVTEFMQYINEDQGATSLSNMSTDTSSTSYISAELLYASMTLAKIPWEAQDWNLNRLQKLLQTIGLMQGEKKPMPKNEVLQSNRELNKQRRAKLSSKG